MKRVVYRLKRDFSRRLPLQQEISLIYRLAMEKIRIGIHLVAAAVKFLFYVGNLYFYSRYLYTTLFHIVASFFDVLLTIVVLDYIY